MMPPPPHRLRARHVRPARPIRPVPRAQPGYSLVELMVGITIGLVIMVFVATLFGNSKRSSQMTDAAGRLRQESRVALDLMGRNLMQAWFGNPDGFDDANNVILTDFLGQGFLACDNGFTDNRALNSVTCASGTGKPAFQVGYRSSGAYNANIGIGADCNGQNAGQTVFNRFFLAQRAGESGMSLYCLGNGNATAQPVLKNVEDISLRFGVDTSTPADQVPDVFHNTAAAAAAATPNFRRLVSVTLCIQVATEKNVSPLAQTYNDCGGTARTATDRKLRVALTSVYTLRNNSVTSALRYN